MTNFGNLHANVDRAQLRADAAAAKRKSSARPSTRDTVQALGTDDRAARGNISGTKRRAPDGPRTGQTARAAPASTRAPPTVARVAPIPARTSSSGRTPPTSTPTRSSDVPARTEPNDPLAAVDQPQVEHDRSSKAWIPEIFKKALADPANALLRTDTDLYVSSEETLDLLDELQTLLDVTHMDKRSAVFSQKMSAVYSFRTAMLAMRNMAVITDAEASSKLKDETIARLEQEKAAQHSALMKDLAACRAQVVELGGKYDAEVATHGKVRRRAEILEKDNADLKTEVNKLKEEQIISKEETESLMKEVKIEYERQLKAQVEAEYKVGYDQGYDDGVVDGHDKAVLDAARASSSSSGQDRSEYGMARSERAATAASNFELGRLPLMGSNAEGIPSGEPVIQGDVVRTNVLTTGDDVDRVPPEVVDLDEETVTAAEQVGARVVEQGVDGTNVRTDDARDNVAEQNLDGALTVAPIAILPPL